MFSSPHVGLLVPVAFSQIDNASDNKNRWVLGFFAWLVLIGWVKEVQLSMMMVGHTHEDIDALFKRITEHWRKIHYVLTPDSFMQCLQAAIPDATIHPLVEYVHDWKAFIDATVYRNVVGINSAREFIIRKRDGDGGA